MSYKYIQPITLTRMVWTHITKKIKMVTERTNYILDTFSTEYTQ